MITVGLEDFRSVAHFATDDFVVVKQLSGIPYHLDDIKLNCVMFCFCLEGEIQVTISGKIFTIKRHNIMFCFPGMVLSHVMVSPHYKVHTLVFSPQFVKRIVKLERDNWDTFSAIYLQPVIEVSAERTQTRVFDFYRQLLQEKLRIGSADGGYQQETLQHIFSAMFFEILSYIKRNLPDRKERLEMQRQSLKQRDFIFGRFMEMLASDDGTHRSVFYYASQLNYTDKYLAKITKEVSGRTPSSLIDEHVVGLIKYQLKHTAKTISDIAYDMDFSTLSGFGKYVKKHLGLSPQKYRELKEETAREEGENMLNIEQ